MFSIFVSFMPLLFYPTDGVRSDSGSVVFSREFGPPFNKLNEVTHQVRIESRVTVRIAPKPDGVRLPIGEVFEERDENLRFEEGDSTDCVVISDIAGVRTGSGDRLVLILQNESLISARLEKSCRARDFYSGFYIERRADGKMCRNRDKLRSRTGVMCELNRMSELVVTER